MAATNHSSGRHGEHPRSVRIGCWSAFWGDSVSGAHQLVKSGDIHYLVGDYLAEVTMGILARQKAAAQKAAGASLSVSERGTGGYVSEFAKWIWRPLMQTLVEKNIRVVTNAGGLDPLALKQLLEEISLEGNFPTPPKIAAVYGDDILPVTGTPGTLVEFQTAGEAEELPHGRKLLSANAYLGAFPIARALAAGAHVVVTGRTADSALVLGPLIHEFGWQPTDYALLAAGSVAGHIIECACQATGGNFTDWQLAADSPHGGWTNMGFPIVEMEANGAFTVTKPPGTGGLVTIGTVSEQILYEIGDPEHYLLPDVTVDFSQIRLSQEKPDVVRVTGVRGRPPTDCYKVSSTYVDGYRLAAELLIPGVDARAKALRVADAILFRARRLLKTLEMDDFCATQVETLGAEEIFGPHSQAQGAREVILRIVVHHRSPLALRAFGSEVAPAATSMGPGISGGGGGRPRPQAHLVHVSALIPKAKVPAKIAIGPGDDQHLELPPLIPANHLPGNIAEAPRHPDDFSNSQSVAAVVAIPPLVSGARRVPLITVCWGRSGDKGDIANIGIIARDYHFYPYVQQQLTAPRVHHFMQHLCKGIVRRYELPGLNALNFILTKSLGGGGLSSLQIDRQGKTFAQILLTFPVDIPAELLSHAKL